MSRVFDSAIDEHEGIDGLYDSQYAAFCEEVASRDILLDDGLTPEQREVVNLAGGRHLVLAPPGTGKTHVLTQRVIRALKNGLPKDQMFCGTFTIRAATEMRERVVKESGLPLKDLPEIGNIHHFCHHFLSTRQLIPQTRQIVDENYVHEMVADCIMDFKDKCLQTAGDAEPEEEPSLLEKIREFFGRGKGGEKGAQTERERSAVVGYKELESECAKKKQPLYVAVFTMMMGLRGRKAGMPERLCDDEIKNRNIRDFIEEILERYERVKEALFVLDFDDLLIEAYVHLAANELAESDKYKWIQVDEVQDLNPLQWAIVELIAAKDAVMVFFGDYEQSIFSFMGASLSVLDQKADTCTMHFFKKNFRATSYLLDLLTRYSFRTLNSRFAFIPLPKTYKIANDCLVRDEYTFDVPHYYGYYGDQRTDYIRARQNKARAMVRYATRACHDFLRAVASDGDEPRRIAVLVQRNSDADAIADAIADAMREMPGVVRFSGVEYSQLAVFRNANALFEVTANPFSRPGWSRLFSLFGGKTYVPNRAAARRLAGEMFELCISPYDLIEGVGASLPQRLPLVRYGQYAKTGRIVVFDTETTGLDTQHDEIIQLSAAEYVCGKLGRSLDLYLKCGRPIPPEAEAVHHISQKILDEKGIDPTEGIRLFLDFVGGESLLVAHNLRFDRAMLINGCKLHGIPFDPDAIEMCDSLTLVRRLHPKFTKYKLGYLLDKLGLEGENSHNAMDDVWAAGSLMLHLADEGARYAERQRYWLQDHAGFVGHFREKFKSYFDAFRKRCEGVCGIRDEIVRFRNYVDEVNSVPEDEKTSLARLEHFFLWTDEKYADDERPFATVLADDWLDVSRMKEADLLTRSDRVIVSTVHKAKGLQFDTVLVPDVDDYPSYYARKSENSIEESKRLLYVAMSRARRRLVLAAGVGLDENGYTDGDFPGHAEFLKGIAECFSEGFMDFFYKVEVKNVPMGELEKVDWLATQYRLAQDVQEKRCPSDIESLLKNSQLPIRRMATKTLEWMGDEGLRCEYLRNALYAEKGQLRDVAIPIVSRVGCLELVRDLRGLMAMMPLDCRRNRLQILDVFEHLHTDKYVRDALEDCLYFSEGWVRKEAVRILAQAGMSHGRDW